LRTHAGRRGRHACARAHGADADPSGDPGRRRRAAARHLAGDLCLRAPARRADPQRGAPPARRVGPLWHTPGIPFASPVLLPFELLIGLRYTHAKRRNHFISFISIVSMAGIALGVMALIVVLSVMNGFQEELRARILGVAAHLEISG